MDLDVERLLGALERTVSSLERDGQAARAVTLARSYATTVEDLWDAVTSAERIPRWFLPVSGRLELGGRYQLEGNAGGTIKHCERPSYLGLTWEFGDDVSWVEAHLCNDSTGHSRLAITHSALVSDHWHKFGPAAVGVGWEMGLLGMELHLTRPNEPKLDGATFHTTRDGKALIVGSSGAGRPRQRERTPTLRAQRRSVRRPFTRATRSRWIDARFRRASRPGALRRHCRCIIRSWALTRYRGGDDCSDLFRCFDKVHIGKVGVACRGCDLICSNKQSPNAPAQW